MNSLGAVIGAALMIPLAASVVERTGAGTKLPDSPRSPLEVRLDEAARLLQLGRFQEARAGFDAVRLDAVGDPLIEARAISGGGAARILSGEYNSAAQMLIDARGRLAALGETDKAASVELNLASLYNQIGDRDAAERLFRANLARAERTNSANLAGILIELAAAEAKRTGIDAALPLFTRAIDAAAMHASPRTQILGLDRLAHALAGAGRIDHAERVMLEAFSIRRASGLSEAISWLDLAMLADRRGDRRAAIAMHDRAIADLARNPVGRFPWHFYQARAASRDASGDREGAMRDLRVAVELVANRRGALPPSDSLRIGFEGLVDSAYEQFAAVALRGEPAAATVKETFAAIEANRAASLAAHLNGSQSWRASLPASYWADAKALAAAEARYLSHPEELASMRRLRDRLLDAEAAAGSPAPARRNLLQELQARLTARQVYLSFHITPDRSWRWAVTRDGIALRELPGAGALLPRVQRFNDSIARGVVDLAAAQDLFKSLFGDLGVLDRPEWIWSANAVLFDLPVHALVTDADAQPMRWLAAERTLTLTPGATAMLSRPPAREPLATWAAVADPVYNSADPRSMPRPPFVLRPPPESDLARLPGTAAELRAIATVWPHVGRTIEGEQVTARKVRDLAESGPSILHLATHVIPDGDGGARIALGRGTGWSGDAVDASSIWRWKVRTSFVAISGCASGLGRSLPATGLTGLTRAWLMAGARDVLATRWPVSDASAGFFPAFYRSLHNGSSPSNAVRDAQMAMIAAGGFRAEPHYWAAYFITGL